MPRSPAITIIKNTMPNNQVLGSLSKAGNALLWVALLVFSENKMPKDA